MTFIARASVAAEAMGAGRRLCQVRPVGGMTERVGRQHGGDDPPLLWAATYLLVNWQLDAPGDPVRIYEEVSEERYEFRKVEEFADGRLLRSDRVSPELPTSLAWEPLPPADEIVAQPEFTVEPLTAVAFESVWAQAADAS